MLETPDIASIAALVGDQARAQMLTALMSGKALTATELATESEVTKQTASAHLSKLVAAALVTVEKQGRHRYYQLAEPDVAHLLESLMGVAERTGAGRVRTGPRDPALRRARVCYDHLAGDIAVELFDSFLARQIIAKGKSGSILRLTPSGEGLLETLDIDPTKISKARRPACRACLDWSARRHHLAGSLGAALLTHILSKKWAKRIEGTRIVSFTKQGEVAFRDRLMDAGSAHREPTRPKPAQG